MAVHHGGKVGKAAKTLATKGSSKSAKSKAGKTLADHKAEKHRFCTIPPITVNAPTYFKVCGRFRLFCWTFCHVNAIIN